ncbi:MAG: ABC transporter ATP-binding protein [Spirochaetales bacterium]|nr:ABC transporter ATP-binding protein [Spirochaetales bacterium]
MIECENLVKIYKTTEIEVVALQGLDLKVDDGEFIAVIGNSGSGKSTLLNIIGGLDRPSAGKISIAGRELYKLTERELDHYRRRTVGFVWQNNSRNLIPYLSALDNVRLPMAGMSLKEKNSRARELLEMVGLDDRRNHNLFELSGGEQQRAAIAIALSNKPSLLLADEPTGSVDTGATNRILGILRDLNKTLKVTVVIVTHDLDLSKKVDRIVAIRDGKVSSEFIHNRFYSREFKKLHGSKAPHEFGFSGDSSTHIEMVVMDGSGRLQLPAEYVDALKAEGHDKLLVTKEGQKIILRIPEKKRE